MTDLHHLSVHELIDGLKNKTFSSVDLTTHFIGRIDRLDGQINSFITKDFDNALAQAKTADELRAKGDTAPCLACQWLTKTTYAPKAC